MFIVNLRIHRQLANCECRRRERGRRSARFSFRDPTIASDWWAKKSFYDVNWFTGVRPVIE
jgi:hypothetical protein